MAEELREALTAGSPEVTGYFMSFYLVFLGRTLRWGGLKGNYLLRLWKTGEAGFEDVSLVTGFPRSPCAPRQRSRKRTQPERWMKSAVSDL